MNCIENFETLFTLLVFVASFASWLYKTVLKVRESSNEPPSAPSEEVPEQEKQVGRTAMETLQATFQRLGVELPKELQGATEPEDDDDWSDVSDEATEEYELEPLAHSAPRRRHADVSPQRPASRAVSGDVWDLSPEAIRHAVIFQAVYSRRRSF